MIPEEFIIAALAQSPELKNRIYPLFAPDKTPAPYCVYMQSSLDEYEGLDGWYGLFEAEYEINILHKTYRGIKVITAEIIQPLKDLEGGSGIERVRIDEEISEIFINEVGLYQKSVVVTIIFRR